MSISASMETLDAFETGEDLSISHAEALIQDPAPEVSERLRALADLERQTSVGEEVSYIVNANVNFTNVCVVDCDFCAFYRKPRDPAGDVLPREQLHLKLQELVKAGGTQVLLQGGHHPRLNLAWYQELLADIKTNFPLHVHGFSPPEIIHFTKVFKPSSWAVRMTPSHSSVVALRGEIISRTRCTRTSAPPPGMLSRPASCSAWITSRTDILKTLLK